jgi:hypothetical protein
MGGIVRAIGSTVENLTGIDVSNDSAADRSVREQQQAAGQANATQRYIFDETRKDQQPWREAGMSALTGLQDADFKRDFTQADFQADPGYAFRMAEGAKALERSAAARGGLNSGRTLKELTKYSQGVASDEYNNAYNRFNADRDRRFNRLSSLAGVGQTANSTVAQAGQNYANAFGQNVTGAANAGAAARMGQANQFSGLIGSAATLGAGYLAGRDGKSLSTLFSDERLKTDIEPIAPEDLAELKSVIKPYLFRYLNPEQHGEGEYIGVMAQDLMKSKLGKTLVFADAEGNLQLDLKRVMMLFLATLAEGKHGD